MKSFTGAGSLNVTGRYSELDVVFMAISNFQIRDSTFKLLKDVFRTLAMEMELLNLCPLRAQSQ
jgi:hypothetical protein